MALFTTPWKHRLSVGLVGLFCAFLFVENQLIRRNGVAYSTVPGDSTNWARLAIGTSRSSIRLASGRLGFYTATVDTAARTVRFASRDDHAVAFVLEYARPDSGHLTLRGLAGQDSVEMRLVRRDEMAYRLMQHRFTWAQDGKRKR